MAIAEDVNRLARLGGRGPGLTVQEAREMIQVATRLFRTAMAEAGHPERQVVRITTKFRDAGRRSPPWRPTSQRVPGRPQDGSDGNRISRWLLPEDHKFYASEIVGTLVEVRYYLQALSLDGAPNLPDPGLSKAFSWLVDHPIAPGEYLDPIQLTPINLHEVVEDARRIQSGHFIPLDRGGKHEPKNAFLMLARSNQLQGNLTFDELLALMKDIIGRHERLASHEPKPPS